MRSERTPRQLCDDLVRELKCLAGFDESRQHGSSLDCADKLARVLTTSIFRAGDRQKDRRKVAWIMAGVAVALERHLSQKAEHKFSYAPALATFIRYVMEECLELPRPSDPHIHRYQARLLEALEHPHSRLAVNATYQQIVRLYRLRPAWSVVFGIFWLFA